MTTEKASKCGFVLPVCVLQTGVRERCLDTTSAAVERLKSVSENDEFCYVIEEVTDLVRQINSEEDSDEVQELLDSQNQELTMNELIERPQRDVQELKP
ncbi:hypothetical protein TNCV_1258091 [Trichonephila clavipes]|nr:hypothetical protein TNCV_1258091 [Trichonephila clavipes]